MLVVKSLKRLNNKENSLRREIPFASYLTGTFLLFEPLKILNMCL
jgi:hypothetical protein